ncbi:MAG: FkbM family methyltransferase [Flavobacteriales bacterium]|nr:FkbM family methyltransferase [Flavobacteriales bacterium]
MLKSLYWRVNFFLKNRKSNRFLNSLGKDVKAVIVETKNGVLAVDPADLEVGAKLREKGEYGISEINQISQLIDNKSSVLIVGAHIGSLAIPIANICSKVVAIEANPNNFKLLQTNVKLNNTDNIIIHNIAASDKKENIKFQLNTVNSGGSKRVPINNHYIYTYDNPEVIDVEAHSLDNYLSNKEFDLVLIDIEGSEYFAMKGMADILAQTKTLIVEFLPHHITNVAGVKLTDFLNNIPGHLKKLTIPSKNETYPIDIGIVTLQQMFESGQGDDGIIFHN